MLERLSDEGRAAIIFAQAHARRLDHDYIGTEHLLLSLMSLGSPTSDALTGFVSLSVVDREVRRLTDAAWAAPAVDINAADTAILLQTQLVLELDDQGRDPSGAEWPRRRFSAIRKARRRTLPMSEHHKHVIGQAVHRSAIRRDRAVYCGDLAVALLETHGCLAMTILLGQLGADLDQLRTACERILRAAE